MSLSKQTKLQHLLWRAGFGPDTRNWSDWEQLDESAWWPKLLQDATAEPTFFDVADGAIKGLVMGIGELGKMEPSQKELTETQKKKLRQQSREDIKSLNLIWLEEMVHTQAPLREKIFCFFKSFKIYLNSYKYVLSRAAQDAA